VKDKVESCHIFILRKKHARKWRAKAQAGDDLAKLCISASANFVKAILNEPTGCSCCDTAFSPDDKPPAFIVLVPVKIDPHVARAHAKAVCSECAKHDDGWLVEQGVNREGLAITPTRRGDQIH
jgi:hypothetical protein